MKQEGKRETKMVTCLC